MPYDELVKWHIYFNKRPYGWEDDERTYMLMRVQGVKEPKTQIFPSLAAVKRSKDESNRSKANEFKQSSLYYFLSQAKGGDKIEL